MTGFEGELRYGPAGTQQRRGICNVQTPQGLTDTCVKAKGENGGSAPSRETAADSSTRCRTWGAGTGYRGWQVAGVGDVQVGGALQ